MTRSFVKLAAAAAIGLFATVAMAQTPAPKPAAPAAAPAAPTAAAPAAATPAPAAKAAAKPRTAQSLECSKEADAKGIHGKTRHKFMSACKKGKPTG